MKNKLLISILVMTLSSTGFAATQITKAQCENIISSLNTAFANNWQSSKSKDVIAFSTVLDFPLNSGVKLTGTIHTEKPGYTLGSPDLEFYKVGDGRYPVSCVYKIRADGILGNNSPKKLTMQP